MIYIEIKTQRDMASMTTVKDFIADMDKVKSLPQALKNSSVVACVAVLKAGPKDGVALDTLRSAGNRVAYMAGKRGSSTWLDVTETAKTVQIGTLMVVSSTP